MSMLRLGRQAAVCRSPRAPLSLIAFLITRIVAFAVPIVRAAAADAEGGESTTGTVVDQAGQVLPRMEPLGYQALGRAARAGVRVGF